MFRYLITIEPLGLLYGSAGRFLSPENLVGRSGSHFPPSAATLSGLFAAYYAQKPADSTPCDQSSQLIINDLCLAGPFWANSDTPQSVYVPTPFNCLVKNGTIRHLMVWHPEDRQWRVWSEADQTWITPPNDKFEHGTWVSICDWKKLQHQSTARSVAVHQEPWKFMPHLHPYLKEDERRVDSDRERGSLFVENSVQLRPNVSLVYLSNLPIDSGWYRFGGEGHMVDLQCLDLSNCSCLSTWLQSPLDQSFSLITPAVWGSNRLSYREPQFLQKGNPERHQLPETDGDRHTIWQTDTLLTERPHTFRYRMGGTGTTKRLSRGRYAVPAGTVYILNHPLDAKHNTWKTWDKSWFPKEGPSLKRWGCGLALPLKSAIAKKKNEEGKMKNEE
jgi:CRISPR-associated protein Cmr3